MNWTQRYLVIIRDKIHEKKITMGKLKNGTGFRYLSTKALQSMAFQASGPSSL